MFARIFQKQSFVNGSCKSFSISTIICSSVNYKLINVWRFYQSPAECVQNVVYRPNHSPNISLLTYSHTDIFCWNVTHSNSNPTTSRGSFTKLYKTWWKLMPLWDDVRLIIRGCIREYAEVIWLSRYGFHDTCSPQETLLLWKFLFKLGQ